MPQVVVLDRYYLLITLLITFAYQLAGFAIAWTFQFDKITDFTGGSNFFLIALLTLLFGQNFHARNVVASVFIMVWATRIAGFLLYRVLKMGKDARFDDIRSHFWKFLAFWIGQILWVWTVSLPVTILNSPGVSDGASIPSFGTSRDIAGIVLWALGLLIETVADAHKYRAKSSGTLGGRWMDKGLWAWSRHPPYFGEMLCWWGIWILCLSPTTDGQLSSGARSAQKAAIASPIFTVLLLLFGSGIPTAERPTARKYYLKTRVENASDEDRKMWEDYKAYLDSTSVLIPLPPVLYRRLPTAIKKTVLLDFPMYKLKE